MVASNILHCAASQACIWAKVQVYLGVTQVLYFLLTFWMDARFTQPCLQTDRAHPLHYLYVYPLLPFDHAESCFLASFRQREKKFLQKNDQWKWSETRYICIAWYWSILTLEYLTHNPPFQNTILVGMCCLLVIIVMYVQGRTKPR